MIIHENCTSSCMCGSLNNCIHIHYVIVSAIALQDSKVLFALFELNEMLFCQMYTRLLVHLWPDELRPTQTSSILGMND